MSLVFLADGSQSLGGVKWLGLIMGLALIYAAIRAMFGKNKKK
jgi:hypothetical protein